MNTEIYKIDVNSEKSVIVWAKNGQQALEIFKENGYNIEKEPAVVTLDEKREILFLIGKNVLVL
jgi:2-hydroxy-3-keto-5-methylthiopentenyl-1-phosphate phosphatase